MVHGAGCCGLRWDQVYRKAHREECMDAMTASVEREANIRHGGNGTWLKEMCSLRYRPHGSESYRALLASAWPFSQGLSFEQSFCCSGFGV